MMPEIHLLTYILTYLLVKKNRCECVKNLWLPFIMIINPQSSFFKQAAAEDNKKFNVLINNK